MNMHLEVNRTQKVRGADVVFSRREIASFYEKRGYRVVWCWEVKTGVASGEYGGKCATKAEALATVRRVIRAYELDAEKAKRGEVVFA